MKHFEFDWKTNDGLEINAQGWEPEGERKAIVCLVHGLGEHSGRYEHVAAFFTRAGYALVAFDHRGHGKSQGKRGHTPTYGILLDDISLHLEYAHNRYPNEPRFLYGHSLGGGLVLEYVLRLQPDLPCVIATAPSLRPAFEPPVIKLALGKFLCRLWPSIALSNELDPDGLSHDPDVVRAYKDDPLVHDRISARLGIGLLEHGLWALEHASDLSMPLLLMHGGSDPITSSQASREFAEKAGELCSLKIWEGLYHELQNEPEQNQILAYMVKWLDPIVAQIT